jgi:hypothetical protein
MTSLVNECRDTFDRTDLRLACGKLAQLLKGCAKCWHLGRGVLEPASNVARKRLHIGSQLYLNQRTPQQVLVPLWPGQLRCWQPPQLHSGMNRAQAQTPCHACFRIVPESVQYKSSE